MIHRDPDAYKELKRYFNKTLKNRSTSSLSYVISSLNKMMRIVVGAGYVSTRGEALHYFNRILVNGFEDLAKRNQTPFLFGFIAEQYCKIIDSGVDPIVPFQFFSEAKAPDVGLITIVSQDDRSEQFIEQYRRMLYVPSLQKHFPTITAEDRKHIVFGEYPVLEVNKSGDKELYFRSSMTIESIV